MAWASLLMSVDTGSEENKENIWYLLLLELIAQDLLNSVEANFRKKESV
jgi:hypothetical protein